MAGANANGNRTISLPGTTITSNAFNSQASHHPKLDPKQASAVQKVYIIPKNKQLKSAGKVTEINKFVDQPTNQTLKGFNVATPRGYDNYSVLQSQGVTMQDLSFLDKVIGVNRRQEQEGNSGSVLGKKQIAL